MRELEGRWIGHTLTIGAMNDPSIMNSASSLPPLPPHHKKTVRVHASMGFFFVVVDRGMKGRVTLRMCDRPHHSL